MNVRVGTSGYAFKEWKGTFYPEDLSDEEMLRYYAGQFSTVEINNTFYRLPKTHVLAEWASQVPSGFQLALKASMRITHHARLKEEAAGPLEFLLTNTEVLGDRAGPILFQLPPNLKKDLQRLKDFIARLPTARRFTIEFRHASWFDDDVVDTLRAAGVAMCTIDQEEFASPMIPTTSWGYVRLHRFDYDDRALATWARRILDEPWQEAYVYFKHDDTPFTGPPAVRAFTEELGR